MSLVQKKVHDGLICEDCHVIDQRNFAWTTLNQKGRDLKLVIVYIG